MSQQEQYARLIAVGPKLLENLSAPPVRQLVLHSIGSALLKQNQKDEAMKYYRQVLELDLVSREAADAANQWGRYALDRKELDFAAEFFRKGGDLASTLGMLDLQAGSYYGLGRVAELKQEDAEASRLYMGVAVLFDDPQVSPESLYRASMAFGREGQSKEASQAARELLERYPDSEWSKKLKDEDR